MVLDLTRPRLDIFRPFHLHISLHWEYDGFKMSIPTQKSLEDAEECFPLVLLSPSSHLDSHPPPKYLPCLSIIQCRTPLFCNAVGGEKGLYVEFPNFDGTKDPSGIEGGRMLGFFVVIKDGMAIRTREKKQKKRQG